MKPMTVYKRNKSQSTFWILRSVAMEIAQYLDDWPA